MLNVICTELLQNTLYSLQRLSMDDFIRSGPKSWTQTIIQLQTTFEQLIQSPADYHDSNQVMLETLLQYINTTIFYPLLEMIQSDSFKDLQVDIEYTMMKFNKIKDLFPHILATPPTCLFSQDKDSQRWLRVNKFISKVDVDTVENMQRTFERFKYFISVGSAYTILGQQKNINPVTRVIKQNLGGLYYLIMSERCRKQQISIITNPSTEYAQGLWGMFDKNFLIKSSIKLMLVKINLNKKLYIPRLFAPLTLDLINDEIDREVIYDFKDFDGLDMTDNIFENLSEPLDSKENMKSKVKVRLLSTRKDINHLDMEGAIQQAIKIGSHFPNDCRSSFEKAKINPIKKIVIHIHGGGWISMSSFSHQIYTRKWANQLGPDCLLVSIDYRLAPEHPYPCALDDCWQVYLWIVYFARFYLNVLPEQIIIAGDSAGANMALGICLRSQHLGVRQPDGLLLIYPAVNLNLTVFTPSNMIALNDSIAPVTILQDVIKQYLQSPRARPDCDPYLSPGIADIKFLKNLPNKMNIICGSLDAMKDEAIKFLDRYIEAKGLIEPTPTQKMYIANGLSHGFMNYDVAYVGMPQVSIIIELCANILGDYLKP